MLPNQASSSRSNSSSVTKSLASGRSLARSFLCVGFAFSGAAPGRASGDASVPRTTTGRRRSRCSTRGSTLTLYGGSVFTRWIGCAVEQPVDVLGLAAVAAEQPVVAEDPQVAGLGDRLVRRRGDVVGIGQALVTSRSTQPAPVRLGRSRAGQVEVQCLELASSSGSRSKSQSASVGGLVVGDAVGLDLRRRQAAATCTGTCFRPSFWAAFQRVWPTTITPSLVDHDRLAEAELPDRRGHRVDGPSLSRGLLS